MEEWEEYFIEAVRQTPFTPIYPTGLRGAQEPEGKAYSSLDAYIDYYLPASKPWALVSMAYKPKVIAELGCAFGARTGLLARLNPQATVWGIDIQTHMPWGDKDYPPAYLATATGLSVNWRIGNSYELCVEGVGLCYIDGDHSYEGVMRDSERAWLNRNVEGDWCIVWDDYDQPQVKRAVDEFAQGKGMKVQHFTDVQAMIGTKELSLK